MRYGAFWIPDSILDEIFPAESALYSGRTLTVVKNTGTDEESENKEPKVIVEDHTNKILWIGALTSVCGLAIQTTKYFQEQKDRKAR